MRLIFGLLIVRVNGVKGFYPQANEDTREYLALANNMAEHGVFSRSAVSPHEFEIFRTPGYPALVAFALLITDRVWPAIIFQNILFLILIYFSYTTLMRIFENRVVAVAASLLLALDPSIIYWNNQLSSETVFAAALFLCIVSLNHFFNNSGKIFFALLSGGFLGFALLTRPVWNYLGAFLFFVFIAASPYKKMKPSKILASAFLFLIGMNFFVAPWSARNKVVLNRYELSSASIIAFGKYLSAMKLERGEEVPPIPSDNRLERAKIRKEQTIQYIAKHPALFAKIHLLSLVPFFFGDGYLSVFQSVVPALRFTKPVTNWSGSVKELVQFIKMPQGFTAVIFWFGKLVRIFVIGLALVGLFYGFVVHKSLRPIFILLAAIIYYFALASGVGSYSRFRFPVDPFIYVFTFLGVHYVHARFKKLF